MKTFFSFLVLIFTFSVARAEMPAIGDIAKYDGVLKAGNEVTFDLSKAITNYDSNTGEFEETVDLKVDGQTQTYKNLKTSDQFLSLAQVDGILKNCVSFGGELEELTVPAGDFETCKFSGEDDKYYSTVWIGKVAFGYAKIISTSKETGYDTILVLREFTFGQP